MLQCQLQQNHGGGQPGKRPSQLWWPWLTGRMDEARPWVGVSLFWLGATVQLEFASPGPQHASPAVFQSDTEAGHGSGEGVAAVTRIDDTFDGRDCNAKADRFGGRISDRVSQWLPGKRA
ncbi:hypothetical protein DPEC_G00134870 [Dallia pectoralis]|uniref:Uncharacterized protein n=1 Tax=Dallia pectoralis TaxID=75939 RepID=A0ACC2GRM6_DALPE|nr:hypothetical protein DPEC_G00134870 [Dallia pectoralis]